MEIEKEVDIKKEGRTVIEENCPSQGCTSNKLYYYTMQLRGADEGATVFYECTKCG